MLALGAVEPQGGAGVDLDGVGGEHALRGARGRGEEARVEAREVAVLSDGLARLVEGRLSDGVVARVELELDELAGLRDQLVGRVGQAAVLGDGDDPGFLGWWRVSIPLSTSTASCLPGPLTRGQARESGKGECCELHFEEVGVDVLRKKRRSGASKE